jgi:F0F1-type ATP synthase delta subunit
MKISPKLYGEAFAQMFHGGTGKDEQLLANFMQAIRRNGDWSRRKAIIAACEQAVRKREGRTHVLIESARGLKEHQKEIIKKSFTKQVDYEEKVNPDLLAGVRFTLNGEMQYDGSLAHMMSELFPSK